MKRLTAVAVLWLAGCPSSAQDLLDRADRLEANHEFAAAQAGYRDALRRLGDEETPPTRALRTRALAHLADLCYLDLHDTRCASDSYRRLIEGYPEAAETFQARSHYAEMLRDRLSDLPGAIAQYKALSSVYADRLGADEFQYQASEGYFDLHDYRQARSEARALLERFPHSPHVPQAHFLLASCYELEGQPAQAMAAFRELIAKFPGSEQAPKARLAVAKLLEREGDPGHLDEALAVLRSGNQDGPDGTETRLEIRRLLQRQEAERALISTSAFEDHQGRSRPPRGKPRPKVDPDLASDDSGE